MWQALCLQAEKQAKELVQEVDKAADKRVQEVEKRVHEADKAADKRVQEVEKRVHEADKAADKRVQEVEKRLLDGRKHADEMKKELRVRLSFAEAENLKLLDETFQLKDEILLSESKSKAIVMDRYLGEKILVSFCRDRRMNMQGYGRGWKVFYNACIAPRQDYVERIFHELVQKPGFEKLKLEDVKQKLERLYENLSTSLHYPKISRNGLFAGHGEEPVRAALCVAVAVAQTTKLQQKPGDNVLEDTVLLLNRKNDVACMIHAGKLLNVPDVKSAQGQQPDEKSSD
jgi:hypothetical protein